MVSIKNVNVISLFKYRVIFFLIKLARLDEESLKEDGLLIFHGRLHTRFGLLFSLWSLWNFWVKKILLSLILPLDIISRWMAAWSSFLFLKVYEVLLIALCFPSPWGRILKVPSSEKPDDSIPPLLPVQGRKKREKKVLVFESLSSVIIWVTADLFLKLNSVEIFLFSF